ncbi:MAG: terminase [Oleispira sp.]|nr:terminase [Oleispira sp.]
MGYEELAEAMTYKWFRLNVLYNIKDKAGKKVLFTPNTEQEEFYLGQHGRDIILKARQLGFTTFKMISDLDDCLFIENFAAGCICHNMTAAKDIYRNKIRFAYRNITDDQKALLEEIGYKLPIPINDKDNGYVFDNGSSIAVSTSYRGGTLQSLHISEFGNICKKYPEKAKEIVTGAFEAVPLGGVITIESTAEGKEGYFYDYSIAAETKQKRNDKLTLLDFKFHFFAWYLNKGYALESEKELPDHIHTYFTKLEHETGLTFTTEQMNWYYAKECDLGDEMKREYPSSPKEAFEQATKGAYYAKAFTKIYKDGRICDGFGNDAPVNTAWDIGVGDSTAIWFYQKVGNEIHLIDYYENSGEGLEHYAKVLRDKDYNYGEHYGPHDIDNRDFSNKGLTRRQIAMNGFDLDNNGKVYRLRFNVVPKLSIDDGINHSRKMLERCVFDKDKCERGIKCLESYRKEWNDKLGCFRDRPLHDWASDGADAFRYLAVTEEGSKKPLSRGMQFT